MKQYLGYTAYLMGTNYKSGSRFAQSCATKFLIVKWTIDDSTSDFVTNSYGECLDSSRLRVVSHFSSGIGRASKMRGRVKITPRNTRLFSHGVIFTRASVSLALLSLRKNGDYS